MTHLCLYQIDSLCPKLTHTVEDVHHPFVLSHVKHGIDGNEAAGPPSSSTEETGKPVLRILGWDQSYQLASISEGYADRKYAADVNIKPLESTLWKRPKQVTKHRGSLCLL